MGGRSKKRFHSGRENSRTTETFLTVQKLLRLRREHPALAGGKLWHLFSDDSTYVFLRQADEERILVVFNNAKESRTLPVPILDTPAAGTSSASPLYGSAQAKVSPRALSLTIPDSRYLFSPSSKTALGRR